MTKEKDIQGVDWKDLWVLNFMSDRDLKNTIEFNNKEYTVEYREFFGVQYQCVVDKETSQIVKIRDVSIYP